MSEEHQAICIRCGELNPEGTSRCLSCKSPLDDFASTSPWEMGTAQPSAYSPAANPRTKPIIFWGVWLYFGPTVIFTISQIYLTMKDRLTREKQFYSLSEEIIAFALPVGYSILGAWALWSVTKGYLFSKPSSLKEE